MSGLNTSRDKVGVVVSNKMDKTVVVKIERLIKHPQFRRVVKRSKKYKVHDEKNIANVFDIVKIRETRPLSADKYHTLVEVTTKAKLSE